MQIPFTLVRTEKTIWTLNGNKTEHLHMAEVLATYLKKA